MFGKITVAKRLAVGFGTFIVLLGVVVFFGISRLDALNEITERIVTKDWRKSVLANESIDRMNEIARDSFLLLIATDRTPIQDRISANRAQITERIDALEALIYKQEAKQMLAEIRERRKAYVAAYSRLPELLDAGKTSDATRVMMSEVKPALDSLLGAMGELVRFQGKILDESAAQASAMYGAARFQMLMGLAASMVIGFLLARWVVLSVTKPLGGEPDDVRAVEERIASGDLGGKLEVRPGDQHSLIAAMDRMQASLRETVHGLQRNAEGVSCAAQQLATSASQVAIATSSQSEAAASMAAAVEEMTVSVGHVSDRAGETHSITNSTGALSQEGNAVINETLEEMREVASIVGDASVTIERMGENSQQISSIVQVIKDVADQTNLLALNAAIEAARAGEQGRGFAVVADEVRKLAERTTKATAEIGAMIDAVQSSASEAVGTMQQAVERVSSGVERAQNASAAMTKISAGADSAVMMVNEISSALREQSVASNEIAANVEKIAQMSEENGAATREVAETAGMLERLASDVRASVAQFKLA